MSKNIGKIISQLTDLEFRQMQHYVQIVGWLKGIFEHCDHDKDKFCAIMKINPKIFNRYISGNYNYKIIDLVRIENARYEFYQEELKKAVKIELKPTEINNSPK